MMAPTLALDADGVVLAAGAAGGTRLRSALLEVVAGILDEGLRAAGCRRSSAHSPRGCGRAPGARFRAGDGGSARVCGLRGSHLGLAAPLLRRASASSRGRRQRPTRAGAAPPGSCESGARRGACALDVAGDLVDQRLLALERLLVAQPLPELDDQPPAVEVALEVEQERLDASLAAAVVRVRPDRDAARFSPAAPA